MKINNKAEEVKIDWEKEYTKLANQFEMLQQELMQEQEKNKNHVCNDTNYDIIRRLDIIGNMLGGYIREAQLKEKKSRVKDLQKELEYTTFDLNSREMRYSNDYEDALKNSVGVRENV